MDILNSSRIAAIAGLALLLMEVAAQAEPPEYQVKAAILYKFAIFVEWPRKAFAAETSPFVACVLGEDPFGKWLPHEMGDARVGNHPVEIRHVEKAEAAAACHMVFIGAAEKHRLPQIMAPLRNSVALVVSDTSDVNEFCRMGGMICLVNEGGKVRFQLNSKAIEQAGLKIDSRLKRVALSADCGESK